MSSRSQWIFNPTYGQYYYMIYDQYGNAIDCHWAPPRPRHDSGIPQENGPNMSQMPDPVSYETRALPRFIPGTPQTGWVDLLDPSYQMRRSGADADRFFAVGRVFAMLYSETAGQTATPDPGDGAYTVVRFGESAYTNIRRFVVIEKKRGFVYACAIGTYSHRGTLKRGCNPAEHAIVYVRGTDPTSCYLPGERERGMTKEPIEIEPVDPSMTLKSDSRIRFGKVYPIEMNVKVKDIGRVSQGHRSKLQQYREDSQ